eukprot:TRINITY_DN6060_c0_g1_i1.p1 TRINITY_DN6060_c0_g1~~TRINITY_DN6060_c0_g1_i1.p1  ORF type:complete len:120 (+),score=64.57 TRINITY_DN6060_c0_g1_i1:93-452(+)
MGMKYLGAYLMAVIGGKDSPTDKDIKEILDAGGISYEEELLQELCKRMDGKTAHELIAEGSKKFAACGGGGGGGGGGAAAAGGAAAGGGGGGAAAGGAKEEKKVVEEEEEDDMEFDLFG